MEKDNRQPDEAGFPDWTPEEFDAIQEDHVFSPRYRRAVKRTVKAHRGKASRKFPFAAAVAAACLMLAVGVYAAVTHADLFRSAFGDAVFDSVQAQDVAMDDGDGGQYVVTYPQKEVIAVDTEQAEALIGTAVYDGPLSAKVNDHTVTVDSAVRDEQAIVMAFTITCDTGVKAFDLDGQNNRAKGQAWSAASSFFFDVEGALGDIYVDFDRTTKTEVHGLYYGLFLTDGPLADGETPVLSIGYTDGPRNTLPADAPIHYMKLEIPAVTALQRTAFTSAEGGYLDLSPIGLTVDMAKGLGLSAEAPDPHDLRTISVEYRDGSVYQIVDQTKDLENYATLAGGGTCYLREIDENGKLGEPVMTYQNTGAALIFNRLVDPAAVAGVTVNGVVYTAE